MPLAGAFGASHGLPGAHHLPGAQLPGAQLPGACLPGVHLPGAQMPGAQMLGGAGMGMMPGAYSTGAGSLLGAYNAPATYSPAASALLPGALGVLNGYAVPVPGARVAGGCYSADLWQPPAPQHGQPHRR